MRALQIILFVYLGISAVCLIKVPNKQYLQAQLKNMLDQSPDSGAVTQAPAATNQAPVTTSDQSLTPVPTTNGAAGATTVAASVTTQAPVPATTKTAIITNDVDKDLTVSDDVVKSVEEGKFAFFLVSDKTSVYAYDPITGMKIQTIVKGLVNIADVAIDKDRNYLFVADQVALGTPNKAVVMKYHLGVDAKNRSNVIISVLPNQTYQVYSGERITGLAVDDDVHAIFVADSDKKQIIALGFKDRTKPSGISKILYQNLPQLSNLQGVACDEDHELVFWGNIKDGAKNGGVVQASYSGDAKSVKTLNNLDIVNDIAFEDDQLYYIANSNTIYTQDHEKKDTKPILVNDKFFSNAFAINSLDGFIYVTDEKLGLYVIKTYDEDQPFDAPKKIDVGASITDLRAITVFITKDAYNIMVSIFTLSLVMTSFIF
ncbi:UNKNOWN [Stylonychia lemnae]|uniref:Uncharacterized protein n=1 Tax=Stylonychia lemnae TaxID=5949 RepID=A0A078AEV9_STYLE|nr:UNKNOWN [Stylonychia lemnae]|eukprot:CDW79423.1 UNKNOWN [Stylonychia lemnae]